MLVFLKDEKEITPDQFLLLAQKLLNETVLKVKDKVYRIA